MHKFLRAAGFSMYTKKKDIEKLLDLLERQPSMTRCVQVDEESNVCEMRTEVAPGLGISIIGELNEEGNFEREFYFPYQESHIIGSTEECSVQRHTEKETYSGMVDENKVGITLIFYIQNFLEFRERIQHDGSYLMIDKRVVETIQYIVGELFECCFRQVQRLHQFLEHDFMDVFSDHFILAGISYDIDARKESHR